MTDQQAPDPAMKELKRCLREANGDRDAIARCEDAFERSGGTSEGGKVFIAPDGSASLVTEGGKVFVLTSG